MLSENYKPLLKKKINFELRSMFKSEKNNVVVKSD